MGSVAGRDGVRLRAVLYGGVTKGGMTPVAQQPIRFDDGAAYERMMGAWSQLVGHVILSTPAFLLRIVLAISDNLRPAVIPPPRR